MINLFIKGGPIKSDQLFSGQVGEEERSGNKSTGETASCQEVPG